MSKTLFGICLFFVGLTFGSFVNAAVWRIKHKKDLVFARSECTKCHYTLGWKDLIPLASWMMLRGKCRNCRKPISVQYPLVELGVAAFFIASLAFWPLGFSGTTELLQFTIWLIAGVMMAILFVYDLKWLILPDKVVFPFIGLSAMMAILYSLRAESAAEFLANVGGSLLILSGFYLLIYIYSKGKWIGFGDVKLGIGLALLLSNWQLALVAFFLANLIGTLVFTPLMATKKISRRTHIPFGPFLIIGTILAMLWGYTVIDWYNSVLFVGLTPSQIY